MWGGTDVHSQSYTALAHCPFEPTDQPAANPPPAGWNQTDEPRDVSQYSWSQQDRGCDEDDDAVDNRLGRQPTGGAVGLHTRQRAEPLMACE
jgi:hypothetical protein